MQQCVRNLVQVLSICVGYMPGNGKSDGEFSHLSVYHFSQRVEFFGRLRGRTNFAQGSLVLLL